MIRASVRTGKLSLVAAVICPLLSCAPAQPCNLQHENPQRPANAGCIVVRDDAVLLVSSHRDAWGLPGGRSERDESPMCTAQRETLEETGLLARPVVLVEVFDNGFHLYRCETNSATDPKPRAPREIKTARFVTAAEFAGFNWRYPQQGDWIRKWMEQREAAKN